MFMWYVQYLKILSLIIVPFFFFQAGDMLSYYDTRMERRRRTEYSETHLLESGFIAGTNMASDRQLHYERSAYSEFLLGPIKVRAAGILDSSLETVAVFEKPKIGESNEDNLTRGKAMFDLFFTHFFFTFQDMFGI